MANTVLRLFSSVNCDLRANFSEGFAVASSGFFQFITDSLFSVSKIRIDYRCVRHADFRSRGDNPNHGEKINHLDSLCGTKEKRRINIWLLTNLPSIKYPWREKSVWDYPLGLWYHPNLVDDMDISNYRTLKKKQGNIHDESAWFLTRWYYLVKKPELCMYSPELWW